MLDDARAVLFDAGQTLLRPRIGVGETYLKEARELGIDIPESAFLGRLDACWRRLRSGATGADLRTSEHRERRLWHQFTAQVAAPFPQLLSRHEEWLARLVAWFDDAGAWEPMPGALTVLPELRRRGLALGVVSNWHTAVLQILDRTGLAAHLDFVVVSSLVGYRKPHAIPFERGLARAGVRAAEAVHVGDSLAEDVEGARRAGIRPVLFGPPEEAPPDVSVISSLTELLGG